MKNKILNMMLVIIIVLLFSVSCGKNDSEVSKEENIVNEKENSLDSDTKETIDKVNKNANSEENNENNEEADLNKIISSLDGLKYNKENLQRRPVVVSIDNHPNARWQAGLSQAEIIYECEVEFPYTRYLCVFLSKEPERVGPVRSARPYLVNYALENDGIFVHVGGSQDAFNEIFRLKVAEVDGLYSGAMWRYYDSGKSAPHNMYTTLKAIRDEAKNRGYKTDSSFEGYIFNEKSTDLSREFKDAIEAKKISITYNNYNTTKYIYDKDKTKYIRYKDDEKHIDELDNEQLTSKNIIILETSKQILDNEGRLFIGTVGKGKGTYITNGEAIKITWSKESEKSRTRFYIEQKELKLNPGNTWIQVVSNINGVTIE